MNKIYAELIQTLIRSADHVFIDTITKQQLPINALNDYCLDVFSSSILGFAISEKRWRAAWFIYQKGIRLSEKERTRGNELACVSSWISDENALDFAYKLLPTTNLAEQENRGRNTALADICRNVLTANNYTERTAVFLKKCFEVASYEAVFTKNKFGVSAWDLVHRDYPAALSTCLEALHCKNVE